MRYRAGREFGRDIVLADSTHEVFERLPAVGGSGEVQICRLQLEIDRIERSRLHGLQIDLLQTVEVGLRKSIPPIGTKTAVEIAHGSLGMFGIGIAYRIFWLFHLGARSNSNYLSR